MNKLFSIFLIALIFLTPLPLLAQLNEKPNPGHPLYRLVDQSPVFAQIFTGFALYDPDSDQ